MRLIKIHNINAIISNKESNIRFKRLEIDGKKKEKTDDKDKQQDKRANEW